MLSPRGPNRLADEDAPPPGPVTTGGGYRLVPATPADTPWLDQLRRRVYADLFQATWGGWDETRHARQLAECLARGHIAIIEVDGARVGMIQVLDAGDAVELAEVQINPGHQGGGLGTRVVKDLIADATARGLGVRLSVGRRNERALRLYHQLGFERVGQTDTHVQMRRSPGK